MKKEETKVGLKKLINNPAFYSTLAMAIILGVSLAVTGRLNQTQKISNYFPGQVNRFCIKNMCLDETNNTWWLSVDNKREPADNEAVNNLVTKFKDITLTNLVSSNKEKFGDYGIGTDPVSILINGKSLEIGKLNASYDGIYVRPDKENNVYDISQIIEKDKIGSPDYWRNKLVTNWPTLQFSKISLTNGKNSKTFENKNNKWDDPQLPETVGHLKEVGYLTNWNKDGSDEVITAAVDTSQEKFILTLGFKNNIYWATTDNNNYFAISKDDYLLIQKDLR